MKITDTSLEIIHDSRGKETLTAAVITDSFLGTASVPAGKSRSSHEAFVLDPHEAIKRFKAELRNNIIGHEFNNQEEFDRFLLNLDGTENKRQFGGNTILALSLAFARAKAQDEGLNLYEYINKAYHGSLHVIPPSMPRMLFNIINGGEHANNNLEFQEFQIIPQHESVQEGFTATRRFYKRLGETLESKFPGEVRLGDEGGYSADIMSNEQAIRILKEVTLEFVIRRETHAFDLSLDVAATSFYNKDQNCYRLGGECLSAKALTDYYEHLTHKYGIVAIEDPYHEEAFADFAALNKRKGFYVVGDDLTSTNPDRIRMSVNADAADAVIIKPNQIGSLTETLAAARLAHKSGWQLIVSHRSGETEDDFIADLAVGLNAWGIKAGAPVTPVRLAKYHRLISIEKELTEE